MAGTAPLLLLLAAAFLLPTSAIHAAETSQRTVIGGGLSLDWDREAFQFTPAMAATYWFDTIGDPVIKQAPDPTVATAELTDGRMTLTMVAPGTTTVVVGDSAAPERQLIVELTVIPPEEVPPPSWLPCAVLGGGRNGNSCAVSVTIDHGATLSVTGTFSKEDAIDIEVALQVSANHVGQPGEPLVVALYNDRLYQRSRDRWIAWDGDASSLVAMGDEHPLAVIERFEPISQLTGLAGDFTVFAGYRSGDEVVYTALPAQFTVVDTTR